MQSPPIASLIDRAVRYALAVTAAITSATASAGDPPPPSRTPPPQPPPSSMSPNSISPPNPTMLARSPLLSVTAQAQK